MEFETGPHSTAALMQARPRGARSHDYWQQASKRGAAVCVWIQSVVPNLGAQKRALQLLRTASQISPPEEASM